MAKRHQGLLFCFLCKIQWEFIYFEICWGFNLLLCESVLFNQTIILQMTETEGSMTTVQTAILLFRSNFFKCETGRPVHFTKDMLSISQLICKRLGRESTPLLTTAAWYWLCVCLDVPIFSAMLSYQYLNFQKEAIKIWYLHSLCCWLPFKHSLIQKWLGESIQYSNIFSPGWSCFVFMQSHGFTPGCCLARPQYVTV